MEFGDKIKQVRMKLKLSQTEMAKELGVAYSTLNRWENGKFKPNYEAIKRFEGFCKSQDIVIGEV